MRVSAAARSIPPDTHAWRSNAMNRWIVPCLAIAAAVACDDASTPHKAGMNRIVAAVEKEGALVVIDEATGDVTHRVDLTAGSMRYAVHNVQATPDGRTAWATAMPAMEGGHGGMAEELVGVDLDEGSILRRIELGEDLHVAHVVIAGQRAFVTAYEADQVLFVDLAAGRVERRVALPPGTGPHGARLTPDGARLVVAGMDDGSIQVVDTATGEVDAHDLPGMAVQTAILPDGSAAFATLYDTRQVARLDLATGELRIFVLPADSAGPVQIYPHPDGGSVWVADQGVLQGRPTGHTLFRLDARTGELLDRVEVGQGPHGVVVPPDGRSVWTTLLVDGAVQRVDVAAHRVSATVPVGEAPNGISCSHEGGAAP
jgi:YVTN family beta-propeller protein